MKLGHAKDMGPFFCSSTATKLELIFELNQFVHFYRYFKEEKPVAGIALRRLKAQDQANQVEVPLRSSVRIYCFSGKTTPQKPCLKNIAIQPNRQTNIQTKSHEPQFSLSFLIS